MTEQPKPPDVLERERRILSLICQDRNARERLAGSLRGYRWRDLVHRVIFEIIAAAPQLSEENLRSRLPILLTKAGFPDFPCDDLFQAHGLSAQEVELFIRERETLVG